MKDQWWMEIKKYDWSARQSKVALLAVMKLSQ
jgi:hypothetical protein